jgi:serine/threonine protein kinase
LREQLRETLDDGVVRLGKRGARGVVFQVTLLHYGYTFVAKAAGAGFVSKLTHEGDVYGCLRPLQGVRVPVFLGAVDLRDLERTYYYDSYESEVTVDHLVHFMFLSYGGSNLDDVEVSDRAKVEQEVIDSVRALHRHGVVHTDLRDANVLWDGKRVMLIDFEQAELVDPLRPALAPVVPNKRAWHGMAIGVPSGKRVKGRVHLKMEEDIMAARSIFD